MIDIELEKCKYCKELYPRRPYQVYYGYKLGYEGFKKLCEICYRNLCNEWNENYLIEGWKIEDDEKFTIFAMCKFREKKINDILS